MNNIIHRRAFIAASTFSIPALAMASGSADMNQPMEFDKMMKQIGRHFKAIRSPMRALASKNQWEEVGFYATEITIMLTQCLPIADQASIPPQAESEYADDKARFTRDLKIELAETAAVTLEFCKALWEQDEPAALEQYNKIGAMRKHAHGEFKED